MNYWKRKMTEALHSALRARVAPVQVSVVVRRLPVTKGLVKMKKNVCFLLAIILLFASSPSYAQQGRGLGVGSSNTSANRRIALVIGNGAYPTAPLKNPPNDATDMAAALSRLGFTVEHGVNLSQRQMKAMIREFGQKLKASGQGLFYFAGHGVQLKGRNYLIPTDVEITSESDVEDQGVDANLIMGLMDEAGNGLNVVILDACRNNPFARSFRSGTSGLAQVDAPTGTFVAYSTGPGKVARDGTGRNGAYTAELLKQMAVPGLAIEEVMKRVRASLKQQTNGEQIPWESSSLVGDFYFNAAGKPSTMTSQPNSQLASDPVAKPQPKSVQQPEKTKPPNPSSSGVINGKAISKPSPIYPQIAKAARAEGMVTVQVTINEEGRVISAHAVSGHPLLRGAAEKAAYEAVFSPTLLSGKPVKVTGVMTYNFVLPEKKE
jgi:TonB family protein